MRPLMTVTLHLLKEPTVKSEGTGGRAPRALLVLDGPPQAAVYRAKFRAFEAIKYLDRDALRSAAKANVEIGTVEGAGVSWTMTAEFKKGKLTRLTPGRCKECRPTGKLDAAPVRRLSKQAAERLGNYRFSPVTLPGCLSDGAGGPRIMLGPIIVVIGPHGPGHPGRMPGCVYVWTPWFACWLCEGNTLCVTPTDPEPKL